MRLLATGSRTCRQVRLIRHVLRPFYDADPATVLVVGRCKKGADAIAEYVWNSFGGTTDPYPADWSRLGKRAGMVRNGGMVATLDPATDRCVAFIDQCADPTCGRREPHGSHGATDCAEQAESAGVLTVRYGFGGIACSDGQPRGESDD